MTSIVIPDAALGLEKDTCYWLAVSDLVLKAVVTRMGMVAYGGLSPLTLHARLGGFKPNGITVLAI